MNCLAKKSLIINSHKALSSKIVSITEATFDLTGHRPVATLTVEVVLKKTDLKLQTQQVSVEVDIAEGRGGREQLQSRQGT